MSGSDDERLDSKMHEADEESEYEHQPVEFKPRTILKGSFWLTGWVKHFMVSDDKPYLNIIKFDTNIGCGSSKDLESFLKTFLAKKDKLKPHRNEYMQENYDFHIDRDDGLPSDELRRFLGSCHSHWFHIPGGRKFEFKYVGVAATKSLKPAGGKHNPNFGSLELIFEEASNYFSQDRFVINFHLEDRSYDDKDFRKKFLEFISKITKNDLISVAEDEDSETHFDKLKRKVWSVKPKPSSRKQVEREVPEKVLHAPAAAAPAAAFHRVPPTPPSSGGSRDHKPLNSNSSSSPHPARLAPAPAPYGYGRGKGK